MAARVTPRGVSAVPSTIQKPVTDAWTEAWDVLEGELKSWERRLRKGQPPLRAGEASRLRSLIASVEAATDLPTYAAQAHAGVTRKVLDAAGTALEATRAAIPEHTVVTGFSTAAQVGGGLVPNIPALQAVATGQIGQLTGDYNRLSRMARDMLTRQLQAAVATGEGHARLAKRIRGIADRTFTASHARSTMIARTSLARAYDLSNRQVLMDAGDLVVGWEWITNGRDPCGVCASLEGMVFAPDEDTYRHPNCRCDKLPVLAGEGKKVGKRYGGASGTSPKDVHLVTRNGWTTWTLKKRK